jgi:hypothetical protein
MLRYQKVIMGLFSYKFETQSLEVLGPPKEPFPTCILLGTPSEVLGPPKRALSNHVL